jgi:hypothetical protein
LQKTPYKWMEFHLYLVSTPKIEKKRLQLSLTYYLLILHLDCKFS